MLVEVVIAGFVPAGAAVRRLFWKFMELIRLAWQLQRRDLSHQRWTGRRSARGRSPTTRPSRVAPVHAAPAEGASRSSPTLRYRSRCPYPGYAGSRVAEDLQQWPRPGRYRDGARFFVSHLLSSLTRALAQAALKAPSPTILESGYPTGCTEGGRSFMHLSFRNPPRFDLMHEGKSSRAVIDFR